MVALLWKRKDYDVLLKITQTGTPVRYIDVQRLKTKIMIEADGGWVRKIAETFGSKN